MGRANEGACSAAAAGRGCPSNGEGSIQETNPNSEKENDSLRLAPCKQGNRKKKRRRLGEPEGPGCSFKLPPFRGGNRRKQHSTLNLLVCVNRKNRPFNMNPFCGNRGSRHPCVHQPYETICQEGRNPKHCNFTGALNSSRWLSFAEPGDKDHLLPIYWKGLLLHSLSCLNAAKRPLPKPLSDIC